MYVFTYVFYLHHNGSTYNPTADYGNIFKFRNVTIPNIGATDVSTWSTTTYATAAAASTTIAGRSVVFSSTSNEAYCVIGYSDGTVTDAPTPPPTPAPTVLPTDAATSLVYSLALFFAAIALLLL